MSTSADIVSAPPDYRAALEGAVLYDEAAAGRIFMRGRDAVNLLQRLSTNDLLRLLPGQGARTVLTSSIGRIIDLLAVHRLKDSMLLATSPDQGPAIFGLLRKNIFFNDQVTLQPAGRTHSQLALYGPQAPAVLEQLTGRALEDLLLHHIAELQIDGITLLVARREPIGGQGFTLYIPTEGLEALQSALLEAGVQPLSPATYEVLRVEQGYGAWGRELSQEYIPLETGLLDAISFTKGCYVGQEIIVRMESRNRLAKRLCGLKLTSTDDAEWASVAPTKLAVDGKEAGDLTSLVVSPRFGPIALAYVRSAYAVPGTLVGIAGTRVHAEVLELPFG